MPSYSTNISYTSDMYRDMSHFHLISRCVLQKTCTIIKSKKEGHSFSITLSKQCQHGFPSRGEFGSSWSDDHSRDLKFARSEEHNLFVFSIILYPPYLPHYNPDGSRRSDVKDYTPVPEINYACDDTISISGWKEKGFYPVEDFNNPDTTQLRADLAAYSSMCVFLASVLSTNQHRFLIRVQQPDPASYLYNGIYRE